MPGVRGKKNNAPKAPCNRISRILRIRFCAAVNHPRAGRAQSAALQFSPSMLGRENDFARRVVGWYERSRRDLPWRVPPGSPREACPHAYHVLVSEAMLQQTQVVTVIPYFQ